MPDQRYVNQPPSTISNIHEQEEAELPFHTTGMRGLDAMQHADLTTWTPQNILQLQRTIGNQAVLQLVRQSQSAPHKANISKLQTFPAISQLSSSQSPIQTTRFTKEPQAIQWLVSVLKPMINTQKTSNPDRFSEDNLEDSLKKIIGNVESNLYTLLEKKGGDFAAGEDVQTNLSYLYSINAAEVAVRQIGDTIIDYGAKKRTVDAHAQEHIFLGTVDNEDDPSSVTGYHWEGDPNAVAEAFGAKTNQEDHFGLYQRNVRSRVKNSIVKGNVSTFFPAAWSKKDILNAIEYANVVSGRLEATVPAKAAGLKMVINDAGFFPDAPANQ